MVVSPHRASCKCLPVPGSGEGAVANPAPTHSRAFSLVEVVLAIGVVSFAMLAILGTLPVGIQSMQDAMEQQAKARIAQQLRSELQQIPFDSTQGASFALPDLKNTFYYYSPEGMPVDSAKAHFKAEFSLANASVQGTGGVTADFKPASAQNVTVTLSFPMNAPEKNRKKLVFTLLAAKQRNT